ncbi:MAG: DUF389 domain-containing protein [Bacteroidales bacterium]
MKTTDTSKEFISNNWRIIKNRLNLQKHIDQELAANNIRNNYIFQGPNIYILAASIIIAAVGLNVNSIPVIIGAMLISPLMGPIIAIGYSMSVNDTKLLKASLTNFMIMVVVSILVSYIYFLVSPLRLENPSELLSRTNPTIYDVLIAIFGGFAGIIEISRKEKGTVFAGVAIATALIPPLCTAGYGLAIGSFKYFIGALYLFMLNSMFIAITTYFVVKTLKFPKKSFADPKNQRKSNRIITIVLIIVIVPSVLSAISVVKQNNFNIKANEFITANKTLQNTYIYDSKINHSDKPTTVTLNLVGRTLNEGEIELLYRSAEAFGINRNQVLIKQNILNSEDNSTDEAVIENIYKRNDNEIQKREVIINQMENELKNFKKKELPCEQITREILAQYPGIQSFSIARGAEIDPKSLESKDQIIIIIQVSSKISMENIKKLEQWLNIRLEAPNLKIIQELVSTTNKSIDSNTINKIVSK